MCPKYKRSIMTYVVAIPSFQRAALLQEKTLTTLHLGKIPSQNIYIFTASKEEAKIYKETIPSSLYGQIVVGKLGITPQRRFISQFFPPNQNIVSIDDDVAGIYQLIGSALHPLKDLDVFFNRAFDECRKEKLYMWGVYPVFNPFFMKPKTSYDLKFIIGALYGYINRPAAKDIVPTLCEKEDYELSILYYLKDGGVVRYNNIGIKTRFHNPNGGLGAQANRFEVNKSAALELARRYPQLGSVWYRKNGMAEFRLKRKQRVSASS